MKKFYVSIVMIIAYCNIATAQTFLGSSTDFLNQLKKNLSKNTAKESSSRIVLKVAEEKNFEAKINFKKSAKTSELLMGEIKNIPQASFYLKVEKNVVEGHIILIKTKEAYKYTTDNAGNVFITKVDINSLVCVEDKTPQKPNAPSTNNNAATNTQNNLLNLQSFPGAAACVLLDFDGYFMPAGNWWNNGGSINAAPSGLSNADVEYAYEMAAEDFRPFNINITTNEAVFNSYPRTKRKRCVITPTNTAAPGAGGVAYLGIFNNDNDVPCWVFNLSQNSTGETISHEVGHLFDLQHDGRNTNPVEGYYTGLEGTPWAPIMGVSFYRPVTQWSKGEYNLANNQQDDMATIAGPQFGYGYRADDYGNSTGWANSLTFSSTGVINEKKGIITNEADIDFFYFTTGGGNVTINANTVSRGGNLDILIKLYNSSGTQIGSYTDTRDAYLNASFTRNLAAGKYFISIDGVGNGNPASGGYSAYASVGSYTITGNIPPGSTVTDTQAPSAPNGLVASGTSSSSTNLNWNAATDNVGVSGYNVYRGTTFLATVTGTSYAVSGLAGSTTYSFSVKAKDAAGNISASSNVVTITTSATTFLPFVSGNVYTLTAKHSNKLMSVLNASIINIHQWDEVVPLVNQQKFRFVHVSGNYYMIQPVNSSKCVEVINATSGDGANIVQWDCWGGSNQLWRFVRQTDGSYIIICKQTQKAIDVPAASVSNGTDLVQWTINSGDNQRWFINPVSATAASQSPTTTKFMDPEVVIYPNPFQDSFSFKMSEKLPTNAIVLYDINGKAQNISLEFNNGNYNVITKGLVSGMYFLKINTINDSKTIKLIKQ